MFESFIREMKRRILSLGHYLEYRLEKGHIEGLLNNYDPTPVTNEIPQKCESIAFVITRMVRFHGGQTSVLRLGTELCRQGMQVYYLVYKRQTEEDMDYCARENLADYQGKCMHLDDYLKNVQKKKLQEADFACATSWDTVSFTKKFEKSYKLYFVQDYEPYFYKYGEEFLMCRSTYFQGLHMISLGSWNRDMILKDADERNRNGLQIDVVDFPYEPREYGGNTARKYGTYSEKKKITIAAYVKFYGKRLPAFIPYMLRNTAKKLKKRGIELEILYFGEAKTFKPAGGKNLGQLSRTELNELYKQADFGLVASMSNISLVPFEMHAAGLPLIEFADGTYTHFLPRDSAILTEISKTDIAQKLYEAVKNPMILEKMHDSAMKAMKDLSWENTGKQFYRVLTGCTKTE
ncbi:MAG: glycosyltransferase family 1 protein [Lachnospiraceae bacterium]|nr:glycosyltransferase family 1 protein [Lachnospiraceae bacterium]